MLDVIIRNGRILDGLGGPARTADLGIQGDRIAAIGDLSALVAGQSIDAAGLDVAPGFVDCHDHSDYTLVVDRRARSAVHQGVTTLVTGNCGFSAAPVPPGDLFRQAVIGYRSVYKTEPAWQTFGGYLEHLRTPGVAVNVAPLVGHGALRLAVMGFEAGPPTSGQLRAMADLVADAMASGACGLSTGLEYQPGLYAETPEIVTLARVAAAAGGIYTSHIRSRAERFVDAVDEAIAVGEQAGLPVQVSHMAPRPHAPAGAFRTVLERIERAADRGLSIAFDTFPYLTGPSLLAELVPGSLTEDDPETVAATLARSEAEPLVQQFFRERKHRYLRSGQPDDLRIVCAPSTPSAMGKTLGELADEMDADLAQVVLTLLRAEGSDFKSALFACHYARESDLIDLIRQPRCAFGADGAATALDGPLAGFVLERSTYGWAARAIQELARERRILTVEEAVRRMTSLPARQFGLKDRGVLAEGARADVVVFDRATVADLTTPATPAAYPIGFDYVFVNGILTVKEGTYTGALAGKVPG